MLVEFPRAKNTSISDVEATIGPWECKKTNKQVSFSEFYYPVCKKKSLLRIFYFQKTLRLDYLLPSALVRVVAP